jgi:hypothetical protein
MRRQSSTRSPIQTSTTTRLSAVCRR